MASEESDADKVQRQIADVFLPTKGSCPFVPAIDTNQKDEPIIRKRPATHGPKKGKKGYVDTQGRIWIKDRAHAGLPDHWDVQLNGGKEGHLRVGFDGEVLP